MRTQYLDLPDIKIAFTEAGSGKPLLFLHGNSESKRIFRQYQNEHFTDFHTYALDSRGHGQSVSNDRILSIEQISRDIIQFCEVMNIHSASVVGYSDGGNVALFLASRASQLFSSIVAISPNTLVSGTENKALKNMEQIYKLMQFLASIGLPLKKQIMRWKLMLQDIGISEVELRGIKTGLKLMYAEHDMIKFSHMLWIASLIPNAETEMIPNCTHMNILNHPQTSTSIRKYLVISNF